MGRGFPHGGGQIRGIMFLFIFCSRSRVDFCSVLDIVFSPAGLLRLLIFFVVLAVSVVKHLVGMLLDAHAAIFIRPFACAQTRRNEDIAVDAMLSLKPRLALL